LDLRFFLLRFLSGQAFRDGLADWRLCKGPEEPEILQGAAGIFLDLHLEDGGVPKAAVHEAGLATLCGNQDARKTYYTVMEKEARWRT